MVSLCLMCWLPIATDEDNANERDPSEVCYEHPHCADDQRANRIRDLGQRAEKAEAERDKLESVLASTADCINTAARECGVREIGNDYRTLAIRDGFKRVLYAERSMRMMREATIDNLRAEIKRLRGALTEAEETAQMTIEEVRRLRLELESENVKARERIAELEKEIDEWRDRVCSLAGPDADGDDTEAGCIASYIVNLRDRIAELEAALDDPSHYYGTMPTDSTPEPDNKGDDA